MAFLISKLINRHRKIFYSFVEIMIYIFSCRALYMKFALSKCI